MSAYPLRFDSFTSDKAMKGHFQSFILNHSATLIPTPAAVDGGGFLPDSVHFAQSGLSANITYTLPTGADMEAAFPQQKVGDSWVFRVVNLDPTYSITVAASTGFSVSGGSAVVAPQSGRLFEVDKAAASSFDCYSIHGYPVTA